MPRFFEQHGPAYAPLSSQRNDEIFETQEETPTEYPPSRLPGSHSDRSRIRRIQIIGLFVATCILLAALIVRRVAYKGGGGGGWTREGDFYCSFPSKIARLSIDERSNIYGLSARVDIGLEYHTIMEFQIPPSHNSSSLCHIRSHLPFMSSIGSKSYETWGDVSEIEIWRVPPPVSKSMVYETLSYNSRPEGVFGRLVGLLDMRAHPDYTSEGFECGDEPSLTVIYRCLRVACKIGWVQTDDSPKLGLELIRDI